MQQYDIVGVGTPLIDLLPIELSEDGYRQYRCCPGGSIAIFLAAAGLQGSRCALLGAVGRDVFGQEIKKTLAHCGVDCNGIKTDPAKNTTCSIVSLDDEGERSFIFFRDHTAYASYAAEDVQCDILTSAKALHLTSFAMTSDTAYNTILYCIKLFRNTRGLISFDVNWRGNIWNSDYEKAYKKIYTVIENTDILKLSEEELYLFGKCSEGKESEGAEYLLSLGPKLLVVTYGGKGSAYFTKTATGYDAGNKVKAVDTTGAGDCFFGVFMHEFISRALDINSLRAEELPALLEISDRAAAFSVQRLGGIPSLPNAADLRP